MVQTDSFLFFSLISTISCVWCMTLPMYVHCMYWRAHSCRPSEPCVLPLNAFCQWPELKNNNNNKGFGSVEIFRRNPFWNHIFYWMDGFETGHVFYYKKWPSISNFIRTPNWLLLDPMFLTVIKILILANKWE